MEKLLEQDVAIAVQAQIKYLNALAEAQDELAQRNKDRNFWRLLAIGTWVLMGVGIGFWIAKRAKFPKINPN
jgi:hypothetical protein